MTPALLRIDGGTIGCQTAQSYTQWVPMHDPDQAQSILPIGQSERPENPTRASTLKLWEASGLHPAPLSRDKVETIVESPARPLRRDDGKAQYTAQYTAQTRVEIVDGRWHLNGQVTYPGAKAEGLLMNVRMVNAVFEDAKRKDFDPEANTEEFLAVIPDYVAHGVRAFTIGLQGGFPGYEGAVNSAFAADGSLRPELSRPRGQGDRGLRSARSRRDPRLLLSTSGPDTPGRSGGACGRGPRRRVDPQSRLHERAAWRSPTSIRTGDSTTACCDRRRGRPS